jgi:hypothetical protein
MVTDAESASAGNSGWRGRNTQRASIFDDFRSLNLIFDNPVNWTHQLGRNNIDSPPKNESNRRAMEDR